MNPISRMLPTCAFLALLVTTAGAGDYGDGKIFTNEGHKVMACGDLGGRVGQAWGPFNHSGQGTSALSSSGDIGVRWLLGSDPTSGSQVPAPQSHVNHVAHHYDHLGGEEYRVAFSVSLGTSNSFGGSSGAIVPSEPWHWNWQGTVEQQSPEIGFFDVGTEQWYWLHFHEDWVVGDTPGSLAGGGGGGVVTANGNSGTFDASASGEFSANVGAVRFKVTFVSTGINAGVLNSWITENFLKMTFSFLTSI